MKYYLTRVYVLKKFDSVELPLTKTIKEGFQSLTRNLKKKII